MRKYGFLFPVTVGVLAMLVDLFFGGLVVELVGVTLFVIGAFLDKTFSRIIWLCMAVVLLTCAFLPNGLVGLLHAHTLVR